MSKHPFRWIFLVLFTGLASVVTAQENTIDVVYEPDTVYQIQFIALKDSSQNFNNLLDLGNLSKEYLPSQGLYRYSIGVFNSKLAANGTLFRIKMRGFPDAFVKVLFKTRIRRVEEQAPVVKIVEVLEEPILIQTDPVVPPKGESDAPIETEEIVLPFDEEIETKSLNEKNISIIYTGKSYGVLGSVRTQVEHELITEYASENDLKFKLVSHASWKSKGVTIILPSDEPEGNELDSILNNRNQWELIENITAIKTDNVLLFQDPNRIELDMLDIFKNSPRVLKEFPEVEEVKIKLYRTVIMEDMECLIIEEPEAMWPTKITHWNTGEFNRVDFEKTSRLFELPVNKAEFGVRSNIVEQLDLAEGQTNVKIDLGHRNADFSISNFERSILDLKGLDSLGYSIMLPFEQELLLGADKLEKLKKYSSSMKWLSTNTKSKDSPDLFADLHLIENEGVKIGFLGVVSPSLKSNLPGQILNQFDFLDIEDVVQKAVDSLMNVNADVIIALSNLTTYENVELSEKITGIDIIISNIQSGVQLKNSTSITAIDPNEKRGLGAPYYVSRIEDYGNSVGQLSLTFESQDSSDKYVLTGIVDKHHQVDDRLASDDVLMDQLTENIVFDKVEKGELLIPAFVDLIEQEPSLETFDATTKNGRMSKVLWEKFIAKVLAKGAPAEIAIVRPVQYFLPLIGKLHEREVRSWLWFEDNVVLVDMKGRDIKRLLLADTEDQLVTSGMSGSKFAGSAYYQVMGRPMQDDVYYRVATTNVISNGVLKEYFRWGLRKADTFNINDNGELKYDKNASNVPLREYIIRELKRIRSLGKGKDHHRKIAELLIPKTPYEKLFSFNFIRPTLWTSLNRAYKGEGYEAIPESRIISDNSFVIGVEGGLVTSLDTERSSWSLGLNFAFAQQSAEIADNVTQTTENADDININVSYHYKGKRREALHPYTRMEYDSEFTSTLNRNTGLENPKQRILRNVVGVSKGSTAKWPILELGASAENDFSNSNYQFGLQGRSLGRFPINRSWNVVYSLTNNFNYYLPNKNDTDRDLSFKYNMIHAIQVPLFGDISLSMAADLFFFQGKTEINRDPGLSMLMKVGISYNRLWKPRFQPLF